MTEVRKGKAGAVTPEAPRRKGNSEVVRGSGRYRKGKAGVVSGSGAYRKGNPEVVTDNRPHKSGFFFPAHAQLLRRHAQLLLFLSGAGPPGSQLRLFLSGPQGRAAQLWDFLSGVARQTAQVAIFLSAPPSPSHHRSAAPFQPCDNPLRPLVGSRAACLLPGMTMADRMVGRYHLAMGLDTFGERTRYGQEGSGGT